MHHRTADSRLLSNFLQHEKEYTKQLSTLLDTSNASLNSLAAYAAASPQPLSQVIMAVAGSLAAADDALRRYAHSIEQWRETMARLKDMEDEVGNIIRDREILVTRLIKASKSSKPGSSIIAPSVRSSSSLSLSNNQDSPSSRSLSLTFSTSSKLSAAQSELQACELHLATKERELASSRSTALHEGLGARFKALIDCGWAWGELGKEGLRSLEALQLDSGAGDSGQNPKSTDTDSFVVKASSESGISSISPSQSASQTNHDHHDARPPIFHSFRSSELLSAPPLTAEFSTTTIRPISMATTTTNGTLSGSGTSTPAHAALLAATTSTLTYAPAVAVHIPPSSATSAVGVANGIHETEIMGRSEIHLPFPAPHALGGEYVNIPLAEMVDTLDVALGEVEGNRNSPPSRLSLPDKLDGQSDEPDQHQSAAALNVQGEHTHELTPQVVGMQGDEPVREQKVPDSEKEGNTGEGYSRKAIQDPESSSDEAQVLQKLELVENPRFGYEKQRGAEEKIEGLADGRERYRIPFGSPHLPQTQSGTRVVANDKNAKTSSPSKTFLGSLRGFFGSKEKSSSVSHSKAKLRAPTPDSSDSDSSSTNDDDWRLPTAKKKKKVLKTLLFRPPDKKTTSTSAKLELGKGGFDSWNGNPSGSGSGLTGGKRKVMGKSRAEESSRTANSSEVWSGPTATSMGRVKAGSVDRLELGGTGKQENHKGRTRASSDVGTSIGGSQSHSPPSSRLKSTRRLKKNRTVVDGGGVERSGSIGSDLDIRPNNGSKPTKTAFEGPPVAVSAAVAKATWVKDYPAGAAIATSSFDQNKEIEKSRKSNSVDIGFAGRKKEGRESYVLIDDPDHEGDGKGNLGSPTPSFSKGQIIDLGESRAREEERGREEVAQKRGKDVESSRNAAALRSAVKETGMVVSRSSSLSSPKKATTVLSVHSNEEGSAMPLVRRLSRNPSFGTKGGSDLGKTRKTDSLGQSSFSAAGTRSSTPSSRPTSPLHVSASIPKSTPETGPGPTSKTTTAPATMSLMSIVEDVKRIREAGQITTSASGKSGTIETVRAPPRTSREGLENFAGHRGAGRPGGDEEDTAAGSVLFQAQAPGSVFDHKHQTNTGPNNNSSTSTPSTSALGVGVQQRQGPGQVIKTPLKSALKNTSRTPSPSPRFMSPALPLVASASVSTMSNGITHLGPPLSITGQGLVDAENESTYESGEEEFFTDEGDLNAENGHNRVEDNPTTAIYTVLPTANDQTPRKRKSVRVSLKPTFSPSPPAIEYGEEENSYGRAASSRHQKSENSDPPVAGKHKQISSHGEGNQNDSWVDSSDEDEEYKNAKAALSRAARKDKEVSQSVFGH